MYLFSQAFSVKNSSKSNFAHICSYKAFFIHFQMAETNQRNPADGSDEQSNPERILKIKKYLAPWRRVEQRKTVMTALIHTFIKHVSSDEGSSVSHICPWEMRESFSLLINKGYTQNPICITM